MGNLDFIFIVMYKNEYNFLRQNDIFPNEIYEFSVNGTVSYTVNLKKII